MYSFSFNFAGTISILEAFCRWVTRSVVFSSIGLRLCWRLRQYAEDKRFQWKWMNTKRSTPTRIIPPPNDSENQLSIHIHGIIVGFWTILVIMAYTVILNKRTRICNSFPASSPFLEFPLILYTRTRYIRNHWRVKYSQIFLFPTSPRTRTRLLRAEFVKVYGTKHVRVWWK